MKSMKEGLGSSPVALQLPILNETDFLGVVDLVSMQQVLWEPIAGAARKVNSPIIRQLHPEDELYETAQEARRQMMEVVAEMDETFMEIYFKFENNLDDIPHDALVSAIKRQTLLCNLVPTFCGASLKGKGIQPLLNGIIHFLPSPADRPPVDARDSKSRASKKIPASSTELCALAFKVTHDTMRGALIYVRVYSGSILARQVLRNSTRNLKERVSNLLKVSADDMEPIESINAGEVGCIVGLKQTLSGDTLVTDQGPLQNYVLAGLELPKSVFSIAIEPDTSSQQDNLEKALSILCLEDPSLVVELDKESGQTLLRGIGELHLEIVCDKLRRRFGIEVTTRKAYVAFRESLLLDAAEEEMNFVYDRVIGSKRLFAGLSYVISRRVDKGTPRIDYQSIADSLSTDEKSALEDAYSSSVNRGPAGYPAVGFDIRLTSMQRDHHTCSGSIRACVSNLVYSLLRGPRRVLLEPIMSLELYLPSVYVGEVLSDLTSKRRGIVKEVKTEESSTVVIGQVPLATMLGYASSIRSMTQGEGSFTLEYLDHVEVDETFIQSSS